MADALEIEVGGAGGAALEPGPGGVFRSGGFNEAGRVRVLPGRRARDHARPWGGAAHHPAALPPRGIDGEAFLPEAGAGPWGTGVDPDPRRIAFPSGAQGPNELCPADPRATSPGARADGHDRVPPVAGAARARRPPRRAAHRPRPAAPAPNFAVAAVVGRGAQGRVLDELGFTGWPKTSGGRGRARVHQDQARLDPSSRPGGAVDRAGPRGGAPPPRPGDHQVVEGGARRARCSWTSNQMAPRPAPSPARYSLRANAPARPPPTPLRLGGAAGRGSPTTSTCRTVPARIAEVGDPARPAIDDVAHDHQRAAGVVRGATAANGEGENAVPPEYPKMEGEPHGGSSPAAPPQSRTP